MRLHFAKPSESHESRNRFRYRNAQKQPTQNTVAKKRAGQEDVDSDHLFANSLERHAFRYNPCLLPAGRSLLWEQEEQVTSLLSMAKAESDYTADNFLQWFVKEQLEEVSSMGQLLRVVQRAGEGNLLRVEEFLAREKQPVRSQ